MTDPAFRPVLYLKQSCPHCLKLRIFLLEAGVLDRFDQRRFCEDDDNEAPIRAELAPHFEKVTFPAAEVAPGAFMRESGDIIALYAREWGIDAAALPIYAAYADSVLPRYLEARRELARIKAEG